MFEFDGVDCCLGGTNGLGSSSGRGKPRPALGKTGGASFLGGVNGLGSSLG